MKDLIEKSALLQNGNSIPLLVSLATPFLSLSVECIKNLICLREWPRIEIERKEPLSLTGSFPKHSKISIALFSRNLI